MRRVLATTAALSALIAAAAPAAAVVAIPAPKVRPAPLLGAGETFWFVKLDGRWYDVAAPAAPQDPFIWIDPSGVRVFTAQMTNCVRADGQALPWTPWALYYGSFLFPLWSVRDPVTYHQVDAAGIGYIEAQTVPGNVRCTGEVPDPYASGEQPLFRDGFE